MKIIRQNDMFPRQLIQIDCSRQELEELRDPQFQQSLASGYRDKVFWDIPLELSVWRNQPRDHRYEYITAIRLFDAFKYSSLVEKYGGHGQKFHRIKRDMVEKVAGREVLDVLRNTGCNNVQCPDLFVFTEDFSDWCFVEVKGPTDKLRPAQKEAFDCLTKRTGKPWYLAEIRVTA